MKSLIIGAVVLLAGCAHSHVPGRYPTAVYYVPQSTSMDCNPINAKIGSCGATMANHDFRVRDQMRRDRVLQ